MKGAKRLLILAVVMLGIGMIPSFFWTFGIRINTKWFGLQQLFAIPVLLLAIWKYRTFLPPPPQNPLFSFKLIAFALMVACLTIYGFFLGYIWLTVIADVGIYSVIFCFLVLGRYDQVWKDLEKPLIVLFYIVAVMVLLTLNRGLVTVQATTGYFQEKEVEAAAGGSVGYDISKALNFWPIIMFLASVRLKKDLWKFMGFATVFFFLILQIYFAKRAPAARGIAYLATISFVFPLVQRRLKTSTGLIILLGLVSVGILSQTEWFHRLREKQEVDAPLLKSSRFAELGALLEDLNTTEYALGKGMGGYFEPPTDWKAGMAVVTRDGKLGRPILHIGVCQPLLKGGLVFFLLYYSFFFRLILPKPPGWYQNRFNVVAMGVLPVYVLFLFIEGPPSMSSCYDGMLVGLCCARLATPVTVSQDAPEEYFEDISTPEFGESICWSYGKPLSLAVF